MSIPKCKKKIARDSGISNHSVQQIAKMELNLKLYKVTTTKKGSYLTNKSKYILILPHHVFNLSRNVAKYFNLTTV